MCYSVRVKRHAKEQIQELDSSTKKRIVDTTKDKLGRNPRGQWAEKLDGNNPFWRLRIGDYRVIYFIREADKVVIVVLAGHRKNVYEMLDRMF